MLEYSRPRLLSWNGAFGARSSLYVQDARPQLHSPPIMRRRPVCPGAVARCSHPRAGPGPTSSAMSSFLETFLVGVGAATLLTITRPAITWLARLLGDKPREQPPKPGAEPVMTRQPSP